jgi:hypothetical protein
LTFYGNHFEFEAKLASGSGQNDMGYAHYKIAIALAENSGILFQQALLDNALGLHLHLDTAVSIIIVMGAQT